jgi:hypothetical protein
LLDEEQIGGPNDFADQILTEESAPALAASISPNSHGDLAGRSSSTANHHPGTRDERLVHPGWRRTTKERIGIDLKQIMYLQVVGFSKHLPPLQPRWLTITIHAARVPTPMTYDAIRPELARFGLSSKSSPKTTPKKPQGMALIRVIYRICAMER